MKHASIIREKIKNCQCEHHIDDGGANQITSFFGKHWEDIVDTTCCNKVRYEMLTFKEGHSIIVPKMYPIKWVFGDCCNCGADEALTFMKCPIFQNDVTPTNCLTWDAAPRRGKTKSGKQRTQMEPTHNELPFNALVSLLIKELKIARQHVFLCKWRAYMHKIDILLSNEDTLVITSDFGSVLNYRAKQTLNCSEDNHGVADIFFVHYNQRDVKYKKPKTNQVNMARLVDCDKWVFFADSLEKGKKITM